MDLIAAVYADWGLGCNGTQPLVIPADRRHFREITGTSAIIVGRKTLEDFPGGAPLKNRTNIVLTRQELEVPSAIVVHSLEEARSAAACYDRCFVVGGASIYNALLPDCDRVYLTKIDVHPESDVFLPNLDILPGWVCTDPGETLYHETIPYRFMVYERKKEKEGN
ncbi:MAG: dihydrofolate reductase [Oscillospiraceae bacterium]|jgi:dihydrofolate reductase